MHSNDRSIDRSSSALIGSAFDESLALVVLEVSSCSEPGTGEDELTNPTSSTKYMPTTSCTVRATWEGEKGEMAKVEGQQSRSYDIQKRKGRVSDLLERVFMQYY